MQLCLYKLPSNYLCVRIGLVVTLLMSIACCATKTEAAPPPPPEVQVVSVEQKDVPIYG